MRPLLILLAAALLAAGCRPLPELDRPAAAAGHRRRLSPMEFRLLPDRERILYKDVVVRVPESWGGALLPFDRGPYASPTDKAVHSGDLGALMGLYNQAMFELQHPRVRIEYINFDMWSDNFRSALAVALSAGRAPAYYIARDLPQTIEQGMFADLTDLMRRWEQFDMQPEGSIREGTINGRIYTLAGNELGASVIRYRKDWFREAGIFNERGEPGPPSDWTWDDFRAIAKKLTDPSKGRYGWCGQMGSMLFQEAHNLQYYVPDPTGRRTWRFNENDPLLIESIRRVRAMVNEDRSVMTSVTTGWFEWHNEFDASHAAMISSFSPHIPGDSLSAPDKFGKDKPFRDTVGMAVPPKGPAGYDPLRPVTNPIGFDPTLSPEQLEAAFEWCKSWFYGDIFLSRMRNESTEKRIIGQKSRAYAEILALPYQPKENVLDRPLDEVFPPDYIDVYRRIRRAHAPPLPREFGLREPPRNELDRALKAMYSEAITTEIDPKALVAKTAALFNSSILDFGGPEDREKLRSYMEATAAHYRKHFPRYYEQVWRPWAERYSRVP